MVCTGNICRSAMAEVVLRDRLAAAGSHMREPDGVVVTSAGVSDEEHGNPIDSRARRVLAEAGYGTGADDVSRATEIVIASHSAHRITDAELAEADLLLPLTAMTRGVIPIELGEVVRFLLNPSDPQIPPIHADVLEYMRAPRFLLALLAGSTLAVVGAVMQALLRNPLADPYFLGISSGAALGAVLMMSANISMIAGLSAVPLGAFAGAGAATVLVLWLTRYYGRGKSFMILIAGMGIHAVCSAVVSLIISLAPNSRTVSNISYWLLGSLEKASWEKDLYLAIVVLPILLFFFLQTRVLNLMLLGDDTARTLGYRLEERRQTFIFLLNAD